MNLENNNMPPKIEIDLSSETSDREQRILVAQVTEALQKRIEELAEVAARRIAIKVTQMAMEDTTKHMSIEIRSKDGKKFSLEIMMGGFPYDWNDK